MDDKRILFGTAGWSYPDWKGTYYPASRPRGFDDLAYHAMYFDVVEVNNTFYRPPEQKHVRAWTARVGDQPDFHFTIKLHRGFTHGENGAFSGSTEALAFLKALEPMAEAGRLGALLAQFPWTFDNTQENRGRLSHLARTFGTQSLVVELRHASWDIPPAYDFLDDLGAAFCNIDQPRSCGSIGMTDLYTEQVAYFRFHGRNREAWFDPKAHRDQKYDYLYSEEELESWVPLLRRAGEKARRTYVIGNNHFRGQAPANILQLKARLSSKDVKVPPTLLATFPFLEKIVEQR